MKLFDVILLFILLAIAVKVAIVSVDRLTVRDCARGIKGACEEVERLNLK